MSVFNHIAPTASVAGVACSLFMCSDKCDLPVALSSCTCTIMQTDSVGAISPVYASVSLCACSFCTATFQLRAPQPRYLKYCQAHIAVLCTSVYPHPSESLQCAIPRPVHNPSFQTPKLCVPASSALSLHHASRRSMLLDF